ncbi:conserved exported hypothetical protein [Gammaproteobacteria bacterium]
MCCSIDSYRWLLAFLCLFSYLLTAVAQDNPPFLRTEQRSPCAHYDPLKQPFFGELHLHTSYSFDAATIDTRNTPRDAYRFAKGQPVGLPPWADTRTGNEPAESNQPRRVIETPYCMPGEHCEFMATRVAQLPPGRALDFTALTDHAEQLGENNICLFDGVERCTQDPDCKQPGQVCSTPNRVASDFDLQGVCVPDGYHSLLCRAARLGLSRLRTSPMAGLVAGLENTAQNPSRPDSICGSTGSQCLGQAKQVWDRIIAEAEEAYDRSVACTFTSFIGYEYTAMAGNGKCAISGKSGDGFPCWDGMGEMRASTDCPGGQQCLSDFVGGGGGDNLHRNIIFRNSAVPGLPLSNLEAPVSCGSGAACENKGPVASPQAMLTELKRICIDNPLLPHCDVLSIPHNSNLSRGSMFMLPETLDEASIRNQMEPLVEIFQIKGGSECRFSDVTGTYWSLSSLDRPDELCNFENMSFSRLNGQFMTPAQQTLESIPPRSFVRNALKEGILYASTHGGVNPFELGFAAALDGHNGTPGQSEAIDYAVNAAHGIQSSAVSAEALNERFFLGYETNGGGLTVAWAEENSRDALFNAMKNRETYATSGTRPIVRFFGGFELPTNLCQRADFVQQGYAKGVPMGGCLRGSSGNSPGRDCKPASQESAPSFVVSALMDTGWPGHPGSKLQKIQIVKGWIDKASGEAREAVFDLNRNTPETRALVDERSCAASGAGSTSLCGEWQDPNFNPNEHAFYYARAIESPSCRWNQYFCAARGVDCQQPMGSCSSKTPGLTGYGCNSNQDCGDGICSPPLSYTEFEYRQCCGNAVPKTVQQRAWTSPIWYRP